jgi:N-acetylglucosaminyldiphosphoundecaprenol N-acetyl-beta-D-mannosaminyltransferase
MTTNDIKSVKDVPISYVGGWPHIALDRKAFAELMARDCMHARESKATVLPKLAFSMNGQALSLAEGKGPFRDAMLKADYIQADGQSLVIASRYLSKIVLPERIATTDFFHDAAEVAVKEGLSFYILGASEEEHQKAIENIKKNYPNLRIAGHRNGYFQPEEEADICAAIVASGTDVLWIGLGKPKEQIFCIRNQQKLKGIGWIKTCGGLFDFLSGRNSRAPRWMQDNGLEWLHRLVNDPRRFFWRYMITNAHSIIICLRNIK